MQKAVILLYEEMFAVPVNCQGYMYIVNPYWSFVFTIVQTTTTGTWTIKMLKSLKYTPDSPHFHFLWQNASALCLIQHSSESAVRREVWQLFMDSNKCWFFILYLLKSPLTMFATFQWFIAATSCSKLFSLKKANLSFDPGGSISNE